MTETQHISVMPNETLEYLCASKAGIFLDCTLGGAGHTKAILDANPENKVYAIDRDSRAITRAETKLKNYENRTTIKQAVFSDLASYLKGQVFNGILADLGLSSDQLAEERGFSFKDKTPLDMRMNPEQELSADTVVNHYDFNALIRVFRVGGITKDASRLTKAIINARPIIDTAQLVNCIHKVLGAKEYGNKTKDSATVAFQAIRIEVNQEIKEIEALLDFVPTVMAEGGRFVTISFHSLEDSLVTKKMRSWSVGSEYSALWPSAKENKKALGKLLTKKAVLPSRNEVDSNPRSRSARLRAFEFINFS
jgi:16S rRNA (cytosine1402-N4)-methyltransferase